MTRCTRLLAVAVAFLSASPVLAQNPFNEREKTASQALKLKLGELAAPPRSISGLSKLNIRLLPIGFMWIEYHANHIGSHAAWVEARSTLTHPGTIRELEIHNATNGNNLFERAIMSDRLLMRVGGRRCCSLSSLG